MKPARDGLILTEGGAELASYSAAAQAVLLMAVVPLYGWLGTRVGRIRLISIMMTFFSATLVGFYLGGQAGLREGVAFYIWIGLINVFIVSQFWAFANDIYTEGQGRRLFPLDRRRPVAGRVGRRRGRHAARAGAQLHALHA